MVSDTKPRRQPKRRSGEQIVTSILNAAQELLVVDGFSKLTTNTIAKRAGVSVGSVYQYFPNKQAIVAGVASRLNQAIVREVRRAAVSDLPPEARLAAVLEVFCSSSLGDVELRRALLMDVPRSWGHTAIASTEQQVGDAVAALVKEIQPDASPEELQDLTLAMVHATRGATQGAILYRPELLEDGRLTRILVNMFVRRR